MLNGENFITSIVESLLALDVCTFQIDRVHDVVCHELKVRMTDPSDEVSFTPGEIVVDHDHFVAVQHKPIHQMGPNKSGTTGH